MAEEALKEINDEKFPHLCSWVVRLSNHFGIRRTVPFPVRNWARYNRWLSFFLIRVCCVLCWERMCLCAERAKGEKETWTEPKSNVTYKMCTRSQKQICYLTRQWKLWVINCLRDAVIQTYKIYKSGPRKKKAELLTGSDVNLHRCWCRCWCYMYELKSFHAPFMNCLVGGANRSQIIILSLTICAIIKLTQNP